MLSLSAFLPFLLGILCSFICIVQKKRHRRRRRKHSHSMPIPRPTTSSCSRERTIEYRITGPKRMSFVPPDDNKTVDECTSNWIGPIKI